MKKFLHSFRCAIKGIHSAVGTERNMRIHIAVAFYVITAGVLSSVSMIEWCLLLICIAMVFTVELLNTAIEKTCDRITEQRDMKIAVIKDISSGAVLVTAIFSACIGSIIFFRKEVVTTIFAALSNVVVLTGIILSIPIMLWFILKNKK